MNSDGAATLLDPGKVDALPWIGIVPISADDIGMLASFLATAKQGAVLPGFHVCFVADASLAGGIAAVLGDPDNDSTWSVMLKDRGLGHVSAIADVAGRYPGRDLILLAAEATLPFAWDVRLQKAAYAEARIAAASAMCDIDPMFALCEAQTPAIAPFDPLLIDRTAYSMGNRSYYDVPRVHPICTYLRRDALDACLSSADSPPNVEAPTLGALTRRLRASGWSCVLCDYLYVGIKLRVTSIPATADVEELAFQQNHPLGGLRRAVAAAMREGIQSVSVPGLDARPVQLHIMHFWGGGLDKWVRDYGRADPSCINLVFSSFRIGETGGQRLVLYSDPVDPNPIRVWDIAQPIRSTLSSSIEYRRILEQIIREFEVEAIIVSSLIGHTLDAVNQPVRTLVVCHDFYPVCQAINPQFNTTCERCTLDDLRVCARSNPLNSIFSDQTSEAWHAMRSLYVERLLANKIEMVVPSSSVEKTLKRLAPRLEGVPFHLIAHGIDMTVGRLPVATRTTDEPLRIVVLGRLSPHKGTELLHAAREELRAIAEITLVGCGGNGVKLAKACGWNCIDKYQPAELPGIMRKLAPHAGLLPSVIPETYSYTLSELNALGVPAIASALGSFLDRIVDAESGFLFEPTKSGLIEVLQRLHAQPELLVKVARGLALRGPERTVGEMVSEYRVLIPAVTRHVARFKIGIGMQTGLTEPYRHLTGAYSQMTAAYLQSTDAYEKTKNAYDKVTAICRHWADEFDAINLRKRWWLTPRALRHAQDLRNTIRHMQQEGSAEDQPADGTDGPSS